MRIVTTFPAIDTLSEVVGKTIGKFEELVAVKLKELPPIILSVIGVKAIV